MKIRIKNFRSLKDTSYIDIKPLTILIGKNSSGKSSFLRTFPMLKQSVEERTKSPILLYGNYTDFGSYKDIKPNYNISKNDNYELSFIIDKRELYYASRRRNYFSNKSSIYNHDINYTIKFKEGKKQLYISKMIISFLNNEIKITFDSNKKRITSIFVNSKSIFNESDNLHYYERGELVIDLYKENTKSEHSYSQRIEIYLRKKIQSLVSELVHGRTEMRTKQKILDEIIMDRDDNLLDQMKNIKIPFSWHESIKDWNVETLEFIEFKNYFILYNIFNDYLDTISNFLQKTFLNVKYIAPLRATAERYYRIQHLAINEVDPNGKNLPIFLDSLTEAQLNNFKDWTFDNFGFKTEIRKIEGHYSIKIVHDDKFEINLSDMGFGYSQILPILTQLWFSSSRFDNSRNRISRYRNLPKFIVIEQPELHLHPEFQAKFADAVAKIISNAKARRINIRIIMETHSDIIVNRLGDCILDNEVNADDINIVVFDKETENTPTEISFAHYDGEGNLLNWPLGFFQPTIKRNDILW